MNKSELIKSVAEQSGLKQTEAGKLVDTLFDTIVASLRRDEQVAITGFGTFVAKKRAARDGRNPSTGKTIHIPARTTAAFKPAAALKDL